MEQQDHLDLLGLAIANEQSMKRKTLVEVLCLVLMANVLAAAKGISTE